MKAFRLRSLSACLIAAGTASVSLLTAVPASAATSSFPPPLVPFMVQNSAGQCMTAKSPVGNSLAAGFADCDVLDVNQQWEQVPELDGSGNSVVFSETGRCITPLGSLYPANVCDRAVASPATTWKQTSDGRVYNQLAKPVYWLVNNVPALGVTDPSNPGNAGTFSLLILDTLP